jgi:hypothetical protein
VAQLVARLLATTPLLSYMQIQIQIKPTARLLLSTVTEEPKAQNRRSWVSLDKTSATVTISMNNPQKIISSDTGITKISSLTES